MKNLFWWSEQYIIYQCLLVFVIVFKIFTAINVHLFIYLLFIQYNSLIP
jgi:hypothetical protein